MKRRNKKQIDLRRLQQLSFWPDNSTAKLLIPEKKEQCEAVKPKNEPYQFYRHWECR
jgi:hypothetical protein